MTQRANDVGQAVDRAGAQFLRDMADIVAAGGAHKVEFTRIIQPVFTVLGERMTEPLSDRWVITIDVTEPKMERP
jgi:hypothetical protein